MLEILAVIFLMTNLAYGLYAKKQVQGAGDVVDLLDVLGRPIVLKVLGAYGDKCLSVEERLRLKQLWGPKRYEYGKAKYLNRKIGLIYLVLALGGFFALVLGKDYREGEAISTTIERPNYGEEDLSIDVELEIVTEDGTIEQSLPLLIEAEIPKGQVAQKILEEHFLLVLESMLGDDHLQNRVVHDLSFLPSPFEAPIRVTYKSLTPDYLSDKGELRTNNMVVDGSYEASVLVKMVLGDRQIENVYDFLIYRSPISLEEELQRVSERIVVEDRQVILPETLLERESDLNWHQSGFGTPASQVFALALLLSIMIFTFRKEELNKALAERRRLILIDFPDVVTKLTMLINAGMTFGRAWYKIVTDYQERQGKDRPLYEEMLLMANQIQNGRSEKEALEDFGRRTGSREVMRMTAILIQNLRRGNHSLTEALKQLSNEAWDIRTTSAKMLGEKASTKLLLPMGISFITVIIIVMAPTLMSMQL